MKTLPTVAIIGAGPAGLLAAWGAVNAGADSVVIYDRDPAPHPERIFSLQFLHDPCDLDFAVRRMSLHYEMEPSFEQTTFIVSHDVPPDALYLTDSKSPMMKAIVRREYNYKLGRPLEEENSTRFLWETPVTVWSLKEAYAYLRRYFDRDITKREVDWGTIDELAKENDIVISTAPLDKLRPDMEWPTRDSWIRIGYTPIKLKENTCVYNLDPDVDWYRTTHLDGGVSTELLMPEQPEGAEGRVLRKVVSAPALPQVRSNVILAGRWGSWDPKALTHHAYHTAKSAVQRLGARV